MLVTVSPRFPSLSHDSPKLDELTRPKVSTEAIYVAGHSSEGYQQVYKLSYDLNSFDLIGTNEELN